MSVILNFFYSAMTPLGPLSLNFSLNFLIIS